MKQVLLVAALLCSSVALAKQLEANDFEEIEEKASVDTFVPESDLEDDVQLEEVGDDSKMANMQTDLLPPDGTVWRGSTHFHENNENGEVTAKYDPRTYKTEWGVPLHIYRSFKSPWDGAKTTDGEQAFVKGGGILWYGWQEESWNVTHTGDCATNEHCAYKWEVKEYANAIQALAPHKVMVAIGWEQDGHTSDYAEHNVFGSVKDYVAYQLKIRKWFEVWGVTNAVFVFDVSHMAEFKPEIAALLAPLFDNDGVTTSTWVFFNMFQMTSKEKYEKNALKGTKQAHWDSKHMLDWFYKFFTETEASKFSKSVALGIGAWGTNVNDNAPEPWTKPIPQADREGYITAVKEALESGNYPKIKASIYFDSLYSIITPLDVKIKGQSDLAHGNAMTEFSNSAELVPTFKTYSKSEVFTKNDDTFTWPEPPAA